MENSIVGFAEENALPTSLKRLRDELPCESDYQKYSKHEEQKSLKRSREEEEQKSLKRPREETEIKDDEEEKSMKRPCEETEVKDDEEQKSLKRPREVSEEEDSSEESSEDEDDGKLEISDGEELTSVFNSSSHRKKTIHNYVAPMHMREQTLRFLEFPTGVWIDEDGHLCPEDRRSDIYRIVKHDAEASASEESSDDFDESSSDDSASEPDVNWKDELDVKHLKRGNAKKVHVLSNDEVIDDNGKTLSDDAKRDLVIRDLSKAGKQVDAFCDKYERDKLHRARSQKLIRLTQKLLDEWALLKKKAPGNLFKMKCDAKLVISEPSCEFVFTHNLSKRVLYAKYDCSALQVVCECGCECKDKMGALLGHFMDHHICNVE